jgi:chromate transporter
MMTRTFVQRRKDVTQDELLEYNAFCQMLPGPSSTQTVMLIAYKRGGVLLSILTLLIWMMPAVLIMSLASFLIHYMDARTIPSGLFQYVRPMSVGFIGYAAVRMMPGTVKHLATWMIMLVALVATVFIQSPWVFPALLIGAGTVSNFSSRRIPSAATKPKPIKWVNLWLFGLLFVLAGLLSEQARIEDWRHARAFNLFENFYRFGSIVFGGGQVLLPMMLYQFVALPVSRRQAPLLSTNELLTGYGLVQAVPGPVFSLSAYVGGLILSNNGPAWQAAGCLIASLAVFLPSTLLLLFLFPLYQNLKGHTAVYRALEGIHAAIVGIIWASGIVLLTSIGPLSWTSAAVAAITFALLRFTKVPAPIIVLGWLALGWAAGSFIP